MDEKRIVKKVVLFMPTKIGMCAGRSVDFKSVAGNGEVFMVKNKVPKNAFWPDMFDVGRVEEGRRLVFLAFFGDRLLAIDAQMLLLFEQMLVQDELWASFHFFPVLRLFDGNIVIKKGTRVGFWNKLHATATGSSVAFLRRKTKS